MSTPAADLLARLGTITDPQIRRAVLAAKVNTDALARKTQDKFRALLQEAEEHRVAKRADKALECLERSLKRLLAKAQHFVIRYRTSFLCPPRRILSLSN